MLRSHFQTSLTIRELDVDSSKASVVAIIYGLVGDEVLSTKLFVDLIK